ncbi:hypothetical protein BV22DRAFT_1122238 [Leucogyrophana mollusca]|uniref:Uncharacterized protein n=1 Tax=Leucogyrophana mollusca TaxID=85980 RepID=A0ACB8B686_9AGAM|nr:hypothetical protein BV22DRAFT_1122238 [Leucogyrophana mollusca]
MELLPLVSPWNRVLGLARLSPGGLMVTQPSSSVLNSHTPSPSPLSHQTTRTPPPSARDWRREKMYWKPHGVKPDWIDVPHPELLVTAFDRYSYDFLPNVGDDWRLGRFWGDGTNIFCVLRQS